MDTETKFLTAFYAVIVTLVGAGCLFMLFSADLASLVTIVVAMFAMMVLMVVTTLGDDADREHDAR